ncbi:MAG TPA: hypothetical protein VHA14_01630 [Bryobacteraceae bacterium]|nr:hypothetical protein [Bryobacteraceae bacterium]
MNPDTVQHINVKVFAKNAGNGEVVNVFHRWIKDSVCPELLIDVAEYNHVPAGPGVLLIGLEANYSLDNRENRPGLVYNRKASDEGTFQEKLAQAHAAALAACDRLENETSLKFDRNNIEVFVNDRLLAPNTEETWQTLEPELKKYFKNAQVQKVGEPRDLFRVAVTT